MGTGSLPTARKSRFWVHQRLAHISNQYPDTAGYPAEADRVLLDVHPVPSTGGGMFPGWTEAPANTPCNLTHGNYDVAEFAWLSSPDRTAGTCSTTPSSILAWRSQRSERDPREHPGSGLGFANMNGTVDTTKILADMATYQDTYVNPDDAFPEIPLYYWKTVVLKGTNMHNVVNNATSATNTWNIEDWWRS